MNLKITFFTLLIVFLWTISCSSQIGVGQGLQSSKLEQLSDEVYRKFKNTTTIFIARDQDDLDSLQIYVSKFWTITPIKFVYFEDAMKYINNDNYSVFEIHSVRLSVGDTGGCSYTWLSLNMPDIDSNGSEILRRLVRIELHTDFTTMTKKFKEGTNEFSDYIYKEGKIYNWKFHNLISYLKNAHSYLEENKASPFVKYDSRNVALKKLKRQKLYIPQSVFVDFKVMGGIEGVSDSEKILSDYDYKYEIVEDEDLDELAAILTLAI